MFIIPIKVVTSCELGGGHCGYIMSETFIYIYINKP